MRGLLSIFLITSVLTVSAQGDIVYSHYLLNPSFYNPAFVGNANVSHAIFQFRSQWTGYQPSFDASGGAPVTQSLTAVIPTKGRFSGFGILATNDQLGPVNNIAVGVPFAFKFSGGTSEITVGLTPMLYTQILDFNQLRFVNPGDPFNIGTRETQSAFNITGGILFSHTSGVNIGFSSININEPIIDYGVDSLVNKLPRFYSLIASMEFDLTRKLSLVPNLHMRTDASSYSFDLGAILNYDARGWAGLSYRYAEAITFMVGYALLAENKLQIGYALDYVIDEQNAKQPTSQEIFVRYNLPNLVVGGRKQVKTPRFAY